MPTADFLLVALSILQGSVNESGGSAFAPDHAFLFAGSTFLLVFVLSLMYTYWVDHALDVAVCENPARSRFTER